MTAVVPGYPAAKAGFQEGDRVVGIEGEPVQSWSEMTAIVKRNPGRALQFEVLRDGQRVTLTVTPTAETSDVDGQTVREGKIGISGNQSAIRSSSVAEALYDGMRATWKWSELTTSERKRHLHATGAAGTRGQE